MHIKNAEHLFERQLSLINSVEEQLSKALPRWAEAVDRKALAKALNRHAEETQGQLERLERAAEKIDDLRIKRIKDNAFAALVEDTDDIIESTEEGPIRDAALIGAVRKIEHYEIAAYGTLRVLAKQLGYSKVRDLLKETLVEEKATDEKLTELLKKKIKPVAD
ncbi:YciE/YciF ferroxidase family protein [Yaniella halotolerans]|uniref:YciE/YciF ferroxidase family protein n=1 Tax=Yaniella halotolerans TaxID=225453 RepID=UPI0003B66CC6|nr:DUF892 family protein [Yaniella halotolerans]